MKNDYTFVDGTLLSSVIEALIFASDEPIDGSKIRKIILESEEQLEVNEDTISDMVGRLNNRYDENGLSFRIKELGGGYTFVTEPKYHYWLSVFQHENAYRKLSQSAIETLAIVAYRQPITKPEVDQIRGVDSGYILRQLMEKALIEVSGRLDSPGNPLLYRTTKHFLRHFGINSVDELPKPREIDEILKDDDMAEHRQLLLERQMMMDMDEEDQPEQVDSFLEQGLEGNEGTQSSDDKDSEAEKSEEEGESEISDSVKTDEVDSIEEKTALNQESDEDQDKEEDDEKE